MEEAAFVVGKVAKGLASLMFAFGDILSTFVPDGSSKAAERKRRRGRER
ncbi:hypothetical protein ACWCXB_12100 [Streptomyces sp. NPDC001514]